MQTQQRKRHQYFADQTKDFSPNAILIPDNAIKLHNNCKEGNWSIGDTNYGNRLQFVALKYSRYLSAGDEYTSAGKPHGVIWFVPISGGVGTSETGEEIQLALNLAYYTIIKNSSSEKSGSLINWGVKASMVAAQGYRPIGEILWTPIFRKKSAVIEDTNVSYFVLDFNHTLPEQQDEKTYSRISDIINIFQTEEEMLKLFDPGLESTMRCVDGLEPAAIAALSENLRVSRVALASS